MIFLRPWWLLGVVVPLFFWGLRKRKEGKNPWAAVIDKKLLKALTIQTKIPFSKNTLSKLMFIFWQLCVIALAGPAWDKLPVPSAQVKPNTVIVLDLNKDQTSQQLQQMHIKLYDILNLLKEDRVGLVLFGTHQGYTAMPLTPDIQLVNNLIPSLIPSVLPEEATNVQAGIDEAEKMLIQTGGQGRIIVITDKNVPHSKFKTIPFNPQKDSLNKLSDTFQNANHFILTPEEGNYTSDVWYDRGIWLALLALIPACLLFRKNVIFLWLILGHLSVAQAGWFQRPDQERYTLNQEGISAYKTGNYQQAEENFKKANHPYNQGNALAFQGKIQEAIEAYQKALKKNPNDEDAKFNKEYLEKQLKNDSNQSQQNKNQESQQNQEEKQDQDNSNDSQEKEQENKDKSEDKNQQEEQQNQDPTQDETQKELEQALAQEEAQEPFNQEEQQILNRLNHDPARVLRYRINLQQKQGFMP